MDYYINHNRDLTLFTREWNTHWRKEEELLWHFSLKAKKMDGYQFIRNCSVNDTKVDFICKRLYLIIEIKRSASYMKSVVDRKREKELKNLGYTVLTFSESQVINQIEKLADRIRDTVKMLERK
jgi:very-short-patch-repair endonuclease